MSGPWLLWQLLDSGFPAGGFAHSAGLEAAAAAGEVRGADALLRFARESVWQAAHGALPLVTAAHAEPARLGDLDARADAFLANHVANRASRMQGRALLDTCARIFPQGQGALSARLEELRSRASTLRLHRHHAPLCGAIFQAFEVPRAESQRLFLWLGARAVISAGVRLNLVGTHEGQGLLHALGPVLDAALAACAGRGPEELVQTSPLLDLFAATHDRLYSRLFLS